VARGTERETGECGAGAGECGALWTALRGDDGALDTVTIGEEEIDDFDSFAPIKSTVTVRSQA
jgi:hypothetical protein